jgi:hypothetical protein
VGGPTLVDSAKVSSGVRTGFFRKKIKVSDSSNNMGTYIAEAMVYKGGKTGIKTWTWTVKAEFDTASIKTMMDNNWGDEWGTLHPGANAKRIYVKTDGNDSNGGTSWTDAVATIRVGHQKCTEAIEYYVYVAPETYSASYCTVTTANVHFIGSGMENCFVNATTGGYPFRVRAQGCEIAGFNISGGTDCIWVDTAYCSIHDNRIRNKSPNGDPLVLAYTSHSHRVYNNHIISGYAMGMSIQADYSMIYNNFIDSIPSTKVGIIISSDAKWNLVYNNIIKVLGTGKGIDLASGTGDNLIVNNYVWTATQGNEYPKTYSSATMFLSNHQRSFRWAQDTTSTLEEDMGALLAKGDTTGAVNYLRTKTVEPEVKVLSTDSLAYISQIGSITAVDSVRKVYLVDSLQQEVVAQTDTTKIKAMNNNNQWGAFYSWNYATRTLTSGAGSGANSVVIRCKQFSDSTNIAATQIQILDSVQNATIGLLTSDSQGRGFFALDNGTYCIRLYKPGWQFTVPETMNVNGNEDTTYYADVFDPGSPPQANLCRVYGWLYDINNLPVVGAKIQASINTIPLRYENIVISPYYKSTTTDDQGFWYLDLYPNSALNPVDTKYIFFIYNPSGTILRIETPVPNQASWELQW